VAYSQKNLNEGEEIVLDLQPHWWVFSISSGVAVLGLIAAGVFNDTILKYPAYILLLAGLGWLGIVYAKWRNTNFVVTNRRVIYREGILSKQGVEIPLGRINNVLFHQTVLERMLGAGDLTIESAGERGSSNFSDVRKPSAVQNVIYQQMEEYLANQRGGGAPVAASAPAAAPVAPAGPVSRPAGEDIPEQLAKLADLRDRGILTDAEFDEKKTELLRRL
jgi:membrane protein YdbS with pleckstrin-like domain